MGFPTDKGSKDGLDKKTSQAAPEDTNSNINWQKSSDRIGTVNGRLKFGKQSIESLNKGVSTTRED